MDSGAFTDQFAEQAEGQTAFCGSESRTLHAHYGRKGARSGGASERVGDGAGAGAGGERWHVGGAWTGKRGPRNGGRDRSAASAARLAELYAAASLADRRRSERLLRRICQRGIVAALPYRAHPADVPSGGLAAVPAGE